MQALIRRIVHDETIGWPHFGQRTTYPPGEGEPVERAQPRKAMRK